uniref:UvrD-helicase domain-containing protein n=1 Tax=Clavibacter michiganensis TaxID=28447 RepID=UPI0029300E55
THRIAYGIQAGVYPPNRVMALTFTSRAAAELPADAIWRTGADGAELADDVTVHEYIGRVEASARLAALQESAAPPEDGSSLRRAERRAE